MYGGVDLRRILHRRGPCLRQLGVNEEVYLTACCMPDRTLYLCTCTWTQTVICTRGTHEGKWEKMVIESGCVVTLQEFVRVQ